MTAPIELDLDAIEAAAKAAGADVKTGEVLAFVEGYKLGDYNVFEAAANPGAVLELIRRLRAAEGAARFFYAKRIADGRVLDDETCGEFERQELAVPDIGARVVPPDEPDPEPPYGIEVDGDDDNFN